jgi:hypothetical protein
MTLTLASSLVTALAFAVAGLAFGWGYFTALRRGVELYCASAGALRVSALTIGRLAAALGFFLLASHWGPLPLLAALAGFLATRTVAVRAARSKA